MKALQLLQVWLLCQVVAYATAATAEANGGAQQRSLKFGAKTEKLHKDVQQTIPIAVATASAAANSSIVPLRRKVDAAESAQRTRTAANTTKTGNPARRISRRYDSPAAPPAQLITQYEIPVVSKNRDGAAASQKGQPQQQQQLKRSRDRSAAVRSTAEAPLMNLLTPDNLYAPKPLNKSRSRGAKPAAAAAAATTAAAAAVTNSNSNAKRSSSSKTGASAAAAAARSKSRKTTTTTTTSTTSTPRPTLLSNFGLNTPFNLFSPNFWSFSNPTSQPPAPTKKPPKKYIPTPSPAVLPAASSKEEKLSYHKLTKPTEAPLGTPKKPNSDEPFRIALPTLSFFNSQGQKPEVTEKEKEKRAAAARELRERFTCPQESEVRFQLFPKICKTDKDCSVWNREELCCEIFGAKSCVSGMAKPLEESPHAPILGLIPRKCPTRPLAELWWEVKECESDMDCWPRVCCPDGRRRYCRTSQPELETAPVPVKRSFNYLTEYLECTAPPPPIFDLHPKACTSTFDCFPNVCCQEAGLRHCRPPKKSVLTLMAQFLNVDFVKRLTQNIVIK